MGILSSGIESTNMDQLLFFLDQNNTRSLSKKRMGNMEWSVGSDIKKVATDSLEEVIEG